MKFFYLKAFSHFFAAFCATWVAAGANEPQTEWQWSLLVVGSIGAGTVALKAYFSQASSKLP